MSFGNNDNIFGSTSFGSFNNPSNDTTNENINREATDKEKTQYKQRLNDLYSQHNPDKIHKIEEWINTYGKSLFRLHSLYVKCCTKYNVNPEPIFNSQPENDNEQNNNTSWQLLSNDSNNENNVFNLENNNTNTENNSFNWNTQAHNNEHVHQVIFNNEDNSNTNSSITWHFGTDSKDNNDNDNTNIWNFDTDSKDNKNKSDFKLVLNPIPELVKEKYKVITYDDIAFFARIHKNATKLIFGYVHINYNCNKSNHNDKIIPLEIYTIILAFYPAEIPFYDHVFEVQMVSAIDKVYVKNIMDKLMFDYDKKERILKINRNSKDEHEIIQLRLYQHNASDFHNYFGDLVMFLFDLTVDTTFENIQSLISKHENENDIIKLLVGYTIEHNKHNKHNNDIHIQEQINNVQKCAMVNGLKYIEICLNDEMNVHEMFENIAIQIADKYDSNHNLFVEQWKSFNTTTANNNDDDDEKDNVNNNRVIGTKKYLEKNDFKPLKQKDVGGPTKNNKDRTYYYQNICLVDDIFKGKSPEELHFEDKYDKMAAKPDKRPVVKAKLSFGRNNNNNNGTTSYAWSWNTNDTKINMNTFVGSEKATQTDTIQNGVTSEEIETYSERLREIYMVHNKANVMKIPILMEKYGKSLDDMHGLYVKVCSKYNVEPKAKFVLNQYGQNNRNENVIKVNSIDEYIINEVSKQCKVSKEIAKQSLELSVWNVDIAMNKIKALQKFKCDLSIFEQKQDTEINDEKDREATKEEINIYKIELEKIYERCNKEKLGNVMKLINKTKHKLSLLHELYVRVCSKYDVESDIVDVKKENDNSQDELVQYDTFSVES